MEVCWNDVDLLKTFFLSDDMRSVFSRLRICVLCTNFYKDNFSVIDGKFRIWHKSILASGQSISHVGKRSTYESRFSGIGWRSNHKKKTSMQNAKMREHLWNSNWIDAWNNSKLFNRTMATFLFTCYKLHMPSKMYLSKLWTTFYW